MKLKKLFIGGATLVGIVGLASCTTTNISSTKTNTTDPKTTVSTTASDTDVTTETKVTDTTVTDTTVTDTTVTDTTVTDTTVTDTTVTDTTITDITNTGGDPVVMVRVTWLDYDGTELYTEEVESGSTASYPFENPTRDEDDNYTYTFKGWDKTLGKVTSDTTYQAQYEKKAKGLVDTYGFGATYTPWSTLFANSTETDSKGRKVLGSDVTMNNFTFGAKAVLDSSVCNTQGSAITVELPNTGSINMSATWGSGDAGKVYVYKVIDGVESEIYVSSQSYSSKGNVSLKFDSFSLDAGTYVIKALKDSNTSSGASLAISSIYYEAKAETVDVSFVTNCDDEIAPITIRKDTSIGEIDTISKSGYKFAGWYLTENFEDGTLVGENTTYSSNATLYAKWVELTADEITTINFVVKGASGYTIDSVQIEKGTKLNALPTLTIDGYRLGNWYTDEALLNTFDINTYVFNDTTVTLYVEYIKVWTVTFNDADGNLITTVTVDDTELVSESVKAPYIDGYKFVGWVDSNNNVFDITASGITSNLVLKATYEADTNPIAKVAITAAEGEEESAYVTLTKYTLNDDVASDYSVYITGEGKTNLKLDSNSLYITTTNNVVRADIFGLSAGTYSAKIVPIIDDQEIDAAYSTATFDVEAYDRSGYAHFNYNEGVGAYNNDGTLKDNAIVLYVTDANKNTINLSFHDSVYNKDYSVTGIGNILNSAGKDNGSGTNSKGGIANTNSGVILALAQNDIPLVVRFVGCVSETGLYKAGTYAANDAGLIDGLTEYDSVDYGGSVGDNGHMARMQSGKNITFEGVGDDAIIDGWGFHLICETAYKDYAKNFEVRNLTFINTPEDAIGMEGQQEGSTITAGVERCWVHHNTFLAPHISNPAESDKSEGDGSCDFKRGQYYTLAYNYFEYCHKTNLIGSSDSSLQYNISFHHNIWYNCGSRIPLLRQANIHFYNNYIYGDSNDSKASLSYVSSLRANSYMYAENNYYEGCKNLATDTGGTAKLYNNTFIQCFGDQVGTVASTREQEVTSGCAYNGTSYANFDTNSELFYYDSVNKKSDCYLTSAEDARNECILESGSKYRTKLGQATLKTDPTFTTTTPTESITIGSEILPTSKNNGTYGGVVWTGIQSYDSNSGVKVRGQFATFKVDKAVTIHLSITASSTDALNAGSVVKSDGTVMLNGSGSAVLLPGIYTIISCQKDKDSYVTSLQFEEYNSEELNKQLLDAYNNAYAALPTSVEYTDSHYALIKAAMDAYTALGSELQSQVSNYSNVEAAFASYQALGVTSVETLINQIGTVDENSGPAITIARNAYNALIAKCPNATVSNYNTLTKAEEDFADYAVSACVNAIAAIGEVTYTTTSLNAIEYAESLYNSLTATQKAAVTNYSILTAARQTYTSYENAANVDELILAANDLDSCKAAYDAYKALTSAEKELVTADYNALIVKYTIALINSISNPVVRTDKDNVEAARTFYDSLDSTYQAQVTNIQTLVDAEAALANMTATEVQKSLTASDFTITGASTTAFDGKVYKDSSITGISNKKYTDVSKVVLNATRYDASVSFAVYYSLDGTTWSLVGSKTPDSNKAAADLEYAITATGDMYLKIEITCTKDKASNAKQGTINSITVTCYE